MINSPTLGRTTIGDLRYYAIFWDELLRNSQQNDLIRHYVELGSLGLASRLHATRASGRHYVLVSMHDQDSRKHLEKLNRSRFRCPQGGDTVIRELASAYRNGLRRPDDKGWLIAPGVLDPERDTAPEILRKLAFEGDLSGFAKESDTDIPTIGWLFWSWRQQVPAMSINDACVRLVDWALTPPACISELAKFDAESHSASLVPFFDRPVVFEPGSDLASPWAAEVAGERWSLALNDFPEESLFTLLVDGVPRGRFNDLPDTWRRSDERRKRPFYLPWATRPVTPSQETAASWLGRYRNGDQPQKEQVWRELRSLDPQSLQKPEYAEPAAAVVETMMDAAEQNLCLLLARLRDIGCEFLAEGEERRGWHPLDPESAPWLEGANDVLPMVLRRWYQRIGLVDLLGQHELLCPVAESPFRVARSFRYADPMQIWDTGKVPSLAGTTHLQLGVSRKQKALVEDSGSEGFLVALPQTGVDCRLTLDNGHEVWFSEWIRECFLWGGFPGWSKYKNRPLRLETLLHQLTDGFVLL